MAKKKKKRPDEDDEKPVMKKARSRADDDDYDDDEDSARPKNDVYVGLGIITLLALITGATFLYLDHDATSKKQPPSATVTVGDLMKTK